MAAFHHQQQQQQQQQQHLGLNGGHVTTQIYGTAHPHGTAYWKFPSGAGVIGTGGGGRGGGGRSDGGGGGVTGTMNGSVVGEGGGGGGGRGSIYGLPTCGVYSAQNGDMTLSAAAAAAAAAAAEAQGAKYPVISDQMIEMETYANANGLSVSL